MEYSDEKRHATAKDYVLVIGDVEPRKKQRTRTRLTHWIAAVLSLCIVLQTLRFIPAIVSNLRSSSNSVSATSGPADSFKDDVWPIRQPTKWDISTDYPYPGTIEFDTEEGTWLRLDVHPKSGEIVFDMLGDLYCLPAKVYENLSQSNAPVRPTHAYVFLRGVPHDSDPHFSPDGKTLVFRSDAELGVENIWTIEWKGCWNMDLTATTEVDAASKAMRNELNFALRFQERDDALLAAGVKERFDRRRRRLVREGRVDAWRVTNETYRWLSEPRFHPSSSKIIATKWYTSSRSLGAGEGWVYDVPSRSEKKPIEVGAGERLIGRTLPLGWTAEDYGDQQIGPEQFVWWGEDAVIYSKNVADGDGTFQYSKDVHAGIYAIFSYNLTTKATSTLVPSSPGGASRPELSHDGKTLAFVRRVRDKEALVLKDLHTGTLHYIWYGLTYDLSTVSAPMGTYPSFSFTPSDSAIIIWAAGKIWHVPLKQNDLGERVAGDEPPQVIPFWAHVLKKKADTVRSHRDLVMLETGDSQVLSAFRNLRVDDEGRTIVFDGAGVTYYVDDIDWESKKAPTRFRFAAEVPALHREEAYYSPSFVPGRSDLVIHARWSDTNFTTLELADLKHNKAYDISGLPMGRYIQPTICGCSGNKRQIAFVQTAGTLLTGSHVATAQPGLYIGNITLLAFKDGKLAIEDIRFVPSEIDYSDIISLQFLDGNKKLLVQQSSRAFVIDLASGPDKLGNYKSTTLAEGKMSQEITVTVRDSGEGETKAGKIAFVDFFNVYVVNATSAGDKPVWSKPGNAPEGLARVGVDGGHGITWTRSGNRLYWFLGPYLHSIDVSNIQQCASEIAADKIKFGIDCLSSKRLIDHAQIYVTYPTDVWRLRRDADAAARERLGSASADQSTERAVDEKEILANADVVVITNATLLTMETRSVDMDLVKGASMVIAGGRITTVGLMDEVTVPIGATVFNAQGGYVVPGFIDVHAHWGGMSEQIPARSWELETFLAYGVTTLHNPSSDNNLGFVERGRVENGGMVGPRIFHTGDVIYGAGEPGIHNDVADEDDARSALIRIRAEGGYSSFSYKNYNQYSRASRQRLLKAAKATSPPEAAVNMSCYPEGGMNFDWDLTYIIDGMTTIEHALPVPVLYNDVLYLYARSGTGATPTHIVNYGGAWGEQLVWAYMDVPNDPKLRRFTRHDVLENLSETMIRPKDSYSLFNTSASVAKMVHDGLRAHIGAHGEPPLGLNYHAEMYFTAKGGLSNFEVYRAATIDASWTLGLDSSIGSLSNGKLADFVVYPHGVDLLADHITASLKIKYVARGGRIWDAETMVEEWPVKGRRPAMPPINAD